MDESLPAMSGSNLHSKVLVDLSALTKDNRVKLLIDPNTLQEHCKEILTTCPPEELNKNVASFRKYFELTANPHEPEFFTRFWDDVLKCFVLSMRKYESIATGVLLHTVVELLNCPDMVNLYHDFPDPPPNNPFVLFMDHLRVNEPDISEANAKAKWDRLSALNQVVYISMLGNKISTYGTELEAFLLRHKTDLIASHQLFAQNLCKKTSHAVNTLGEKSKEMLTSQQDLGDDEKLFEVFREAMLDDFPADDDSTELSIRELYESTDVRVRSVFARMLNVSEKK